jgi:hypothetical protein
MRIARGDLVRAWQLWSSRRGDIQLLGVGARLASFPRMLSANVDFCHASACGAVCGIAPPVIGDGG